MWHPVIFILNSHPSFCLPTPASENGLDNADKALAQNELVSAARRITTLEMKELNERQKAEHAQKMYVHTKNSLRQVEERNVELESKIAEVRPHEKQPQVLFLL